MGNAETSQNTPPPTVAIPSPAQAPDYASPAGVTPDGTTQGTAEGSAAGTGYAAQNSIPDQAAGYTGSPSLADSTPPYSGEQSPSNWPSTGTAATGDSDLNHPGQYNAPSQGQPPIAEQSYTYTSVDYSAPSGLTTPGATPAASEPPAYSAISSPAAGYPQSHQPLLAATRPSVAGLKTVPDVRLRRLMGISVWGLFLASAGLVLGGIALIRLMGDMPSWFEPVFAGTGVFGLALVIAGFVTVKYRLVPWLLLSASSVTFVVGVVLLGTA